MAGSYIFTLLSGKRGIVNRKRHRDSRFGYAYERKRLHPRGIADGIAYCKIIKAGYGNYGNLDVLANYLFRLSSKDKLNVRFQMDGMDDQLTLPFIDSEKWDAFYYRTRAGIDYTHQFDRMDLNIAGNFGLSNFNYQPNSVNSKQKFTSGEFHAGIHFLDETTPLRFNAETNLMMYERQHNMMSELTTNTSIKETMIRTKGDVTGDIDEQQSVTIGLEMNNLLYSGYVKDDFFSTRFPQSSTVSMLRTK